MLKLGWFSLFILIILYTAPVCADDFTKHVTLRYHPPGSLRIDYSGLRGFIYDQGVSQLHSLHRDYLEAIYNDPLKIRKKRWLMNQHQYELDNGGKWWDRKWFYSLEAYRGGAPILSIYRLGPPKYNLIDIKFAYLTNDFKFKLREYKINITKALDTIEISRLYNWDLRIKPSLRFSTSEIIRLARLSFIFEYSHRSDKLFLIEIFSEYTRRHKFTFGINVFLLKY